MPLWLRWITYILMCFMVISATVIGTSRLQHNQLGTVMCYHWPRGGNAIERQQGWWLIDLDTQRELFLEPFGFTDFALWSPDYSQGVVTTSFRWQTDIHLIDRQHHTRERLINAMVDEWALGWSPDGEKILYGSTISDQVDLYLYNIANGSRRRLTDSPHREIMATWSPDSRQIAYLSRQNLETGIQVELQILDLTSDSVTVLDSDVQNMLYPTWSPDGRYLLYTIRNSGLQLLDLSTMETRILQTESLPWLPRWSANSRTILYAADPSHNIMMFDLASGVERQVIDVTQIYCDGAAWWDG